MPIVAGLALPTLDKSLFGFRKTDRASASPNSSSCPTVKLPVTEDNFEPAPELPSLQSLNFNSFANLLNHVDLVTASIPAGLEVLGSAESVSTTTPSPSSGAVTQHNARAADTMGGLEFMTTGTYFSTIAAGPQSRIPERQQSSTSSASTSKHSDTDFSIESTSSRSSVDVTATKTQPSIPLESVDTDPFDTNFLSSGFQDTELDLEFKHVPSTRSKPRSILKVTSPILDTNKPLPPAPSTASRKTKVAQKLSLPELDCGTANKASTSKVRIHEARAELDVSPTRRVSEPEPRSQYTKPIPISIYSKSMPILRGSDSSQSLAIEEVNQAIPPRKVSAQTKPKAQTSRRNLRQKSILSMADQMIFQILLRVHSISDLASMAMTNKRFYHVFKRRESEIVENVMKTASPAAWELRQLVQREQKRSPYQIKAVQRDIAALRALQAFMLMRCGKLCRPSTLEGLMGDNAQRRADIENALWRIWTFCKLFGKGTSRDGSVHAQIMWLQGATLTEKGDKHVPRSEKRALPPSKTELEDMSEIWRCMEILLSNFKGREPEAREAGIFDQCQIDEHNGNTEAQHLEDWIYDILSVGPKAVLTMISCSFEHAKVLGVNKWTPPRQGRSRRTFLKAALEQVYRDVLVEEARTQAESLAKQAHSSQLKTLGNRSRSDPALSEKMTAPGSSSLHRSMSVAPIETSEKKRSESLPLDILPDCDPKSSFHHHNDGPTNSPTTNPASFSSLAMMSNASARLGATLFPLQHLQAPLKLDSSNDEGSDTTDTDSINLALEPKVTDPSDRALALLVKQLGFSEKLAKQALAMSDDGAGIDVQRAVELLSTDRRLDPNQKGPNVAELPGTTTHPTEVRAVKDYCEVICRQPTLITRKKSTLRGIMTRTSLRQSFRLSVIMDQEDEDNAVEQFKKDTLVPSAVSTPPTPIDPKASELRSGLHNLTEFIRYRNTMRSQSGIARTGGLLKSHKRSASTGTIDLSEDDIRSMSPVSPMTPVHCLGGLTPIRPLPQTVSDTGREGEQFAHVVPRPKVTLTRVGTGKKPSRGLSFSKHGALKPGHPPEIIGYTY